MTATDEIGNDESDELSRPINIETVDKQRFLYYLSGIGTIDTESLAAECAQTHSVVVQVLKKRFRAEIDLDTVGFASLSSNALKPIVEAAKPKLKEAKEQFKRGRQLEDEGEYADARDCFQSAYTIYSAVVERFDTVNYDPDKLADRIEAAEIKHDAVALETTKDSINYHQLRAQQYESAGDSSDSEKDARSEYQQSVQAMEEAITAAKQYNADRLQSDSSRVDVETLEARNAELMEKLESVTKAVPEKHESAASPSTDIAEMQESIDGFGRVAKNKLRSAGYDSVADIADVSKADLLAIDKIGPHVADHILQYVEKQTDDRDHNTSTIAADTNPQSGRELRERLETHYKPASESGNWYRCTRTTLSGRRCGAKVYFSLSNQGDLVKHEAKHTDSDDTDRSDEPDTSESDDEASQKDTIQAQLEAYAGLERSAFETSWETIPNNERLSKQLLLEVQSVEKPAGEKKDYVITASDRTGKRIQLDIWRTHDLKFDWESGHWYAMTETRGSVWTTDDGATQKRLSSTKDMSRISLGPEFSLPDSSLPTEASASADDQTESEPPSPTHSTESQAANQDSNTSTDEVTANNDSMLDDIMSDFDNI